jgi:hypothetical protein
MTGRENNPMKNFILAIALLGVASVAQAKIPFSGKNYSGVYECKGNNDQVGDYTVTATLRLNNVSSSGTFGAYHYEVETENSVTYRGQVAADGNRLAISFNFSEKKNLDHSTGVAVVKRNAQGHWTFRRLYYEGDDNGGVYGSENCVLKAPLATTGKPKDKKK